MENSIEQRIQREISSLLQNEALMGGLETEAAGALLDWASQRVSVIFIEAGDQDDAAVEQATYPRLRALRQMMRLTSLLATGRLNADTAACLGVLTQIAAQAALVYGPGFNQPGQSQLQEFLNSPILNSGQWIASLQSWLESN